MDNIEPWHAIIVGLPLGIYLAYTQWILPTVMKDRSEHSGHNGTK